MVETARLQNGGVGTVRALLRRAWPILGESIATRDDRAGIVVRVCEFQIPRGRNLHNRF